MQGSTHRVGGALALLAGYSLLEANNMLLEEVNPVLQLAVMYPFALYGSILPDLDHGENSIPAKDPLSIVINKLLHVGKSGSFLNAKHRSWQTHSLLMLTLFSSIFAASMGTLTGADGAILRLMLVGLSFGVISHLILDMLTPEGIWLLSGSVVRSKKTKVSLVPRSKFFTTGGTFERIVCFVMWILIILLSVRLLYLWSPYRFDMGFGNIQ